MLQLIIKVITYFFTVTVFVKGGKWSCSNNEFVWLYSSIMSMFTRSVCYSYSITWTLASVSLVFCANSSLVYTSGYWVLVKALSKVSSWSPENVVLDRRCFLFNVIPGSDSVSESSQDDGPFETWNKLVGVRSYCCESNVQLKLEL